MTSGSEFGMRNQFTLKCGNLWLKSNSLMSCKLAEESSTGCLVHCSFYSTFELLKTLVLGSPVALGKF